jgi:hypothetical protein
MFFGLRRISASVLETLSIVLQALHYYGTNNGTISLYGILFSAKGPNSFTNGSNSAMWRLLALGGDVHANRIM